MKHFYPQQIHASDEITNYFQQNNRYVLLQAPLQSGKTGTYNHVIAQMFEKQMIERAYILCGASDTDLLNQANNDMKNFQKSENQNKIKIIFRQHMKNKIINTRNCLIVAEESHLVQSKNQTYDQFLQANHIHLEGHNERLDNLNCFILSVSATPFSEMCDILHHKSYPKKIVTMIPGDGYYGIQEYYDSEQIHEIFSVKEYKEDWIHIIKSQKHKYNIIRMMKNDEYDEMIKICEEKKFPFYEYNSEQKTIELNELRNKPKQTTIIFIKGMLRVGKIINKRHIGFVWEGSKDPNTDTILQGLFGRVCGYEEHGPIQIYLSKQLLKKRGNPPKNEIERFLEPKMIPLCGMNLKPNSDDSKQISPLGQTTIPIYFQPGEFNFTIYKRVKKERERMIPIIRQKIVNNLNLLKKNHTPNQISEITELIKDKTNFSCREWTTNPSFDAGKYEDDIEPFIIAAKTQIPYKGNIGIENKICAMFLHDDSEKYMTQGVVIIVFRLKTDRRITSCAPDTNGYEIFQKTNTPAITVTFLFSDAIYKNQNEFQIEMKELVKLKHLQILPEIVFRNNFNKLSYHYVNSMENDFMKIIKTFKSHKINVRIEDVSKTMFRIQSFQIIKK